MIVYQANRLKFVEDVRLNRVHELVRDEMERKLKKRVGPSELGAFMNSLRCMGILVADDGLPADAGVYIEYSISLTNKRVDFIMTGQDADRKDTLVLVELKQWTEVKATKKDAVVRTYLGRGEVETSHPSYQVWTYAALMKDFNETVRAEDIQLKPCAYLHNLGVRDVIDSPFYAEHTQRAPVFIAEDADLLSQFLKDNIRYGDGRDVMYRVENGRIKPSRSLADALVSMMKGNDEFLMIDDQKVAYETVLEAAREGQRGRKRVLIVEGGPGTGKSVVAINLLVELTKREIVAQYVTKNAAPRAVYEAKLTGTFKKSRISNLFKGSGAYVNAKQDSFDTLIVDEAHRLNERGGLFFNLGENQIKEIIQAAKTSVFFLDEDQRVTLRDIGEKEGLRSWAKALGAEVTELKLESQFRCAGSDGYLAWLDDVLQIRETANPILDGAGFEFKVFDDPNALRQEIVRRNAERNRARLVAGYCWDWKSKKNPKAMDIVLPQYGFEAQWNLIKDGSLWIISPESVREIGCIHTCQGLEVDYIGVVVGPDLVVRNSKVVTDGRARSRMDSSIKGYRKLLRTNPPEAKQRADLIIKNTYRTLMTRGMKGCYLFSADPETNDYFRSRTAFTSD